VEEESRMRRMIRQCMRFCSHLAVVLLNSCARDLRLLTLIIGHNYRNGGDVLVQSQDAA